MWKYRDLFKNDQQQNDLYSFPSQTIQYHSNPSLHNKLLSELFETYILHQIVSW